ncbi:MAG: hypothetical protein ACFB0E_21785 [Leptolyngbyaceae cyanobacterium]
MLLCSFPNRPLAGGSIEWKAKDSTFTIHTGLSFMNVCQKVAVLTVGSTASVALLSIDAQAQSTGTAADLLPLDSQGTSNDSIASLQLKAVSDVSVTVRPEATYSPEMLQTVASNINQTNQPDDDETSDISDLVDLSFIEQFIDEDGNVDLPLGITVYEAMGTTSIGFGAEFR